jgi:hypothetical protein
MSIKIINNFLSKDYCQELVKKIDPLLIESSRRLYYSEIWGGQYVPKSFEQQDFNSKQFRDLKNQEEVRGLSLLLNAFHLVKSIVSSHYKKDITLFEGGLMKMERNSINKIHADKFKINSFVDGRDGEGEGSLCQFSAILYLSSQGEDFEGGEIYFPEHNRLIKPEAGMLVFFPGDEDHMHEVKRVTAGLRYGITMFMGYEENI